MAVYTTTPESITATVGPLDALSVYKVLKACQTAIIARDTKAPAEPHQIIRNRGEYGAYKLSIQQIADAGFISKEAISEIQRFVPGSSSGPATQNTKLSYYEMAKNVNLFYNNRIEILTPLTEAKNNGQYYYFSHVLLNVGHAIGFQSGDYVFTDGVQDRIAQNLLKFYYNLLLTARVITKDIEPRILGGLLSICLCSKYDDAVSFSKGVVKTDIDGISAKYWYDYGWNSLSDIPQKITEEAPVTTTETTTDLNGNTTTVTTETPASEAPAQFIAPKNTLPNPYYKTFKKARISYYWDTKKSFGGLEISYPWSSLTGGVVVASSNQLTVNTSDSEFVRIINTIDGALKKFRLLNNSQAVTDLLEISTYLLENYFPDMSKVKEGTETPVVSPSSSASSPKPTTTDIGALPSTVRKDPVPVQGAIPSNATTSTATNKSVKCPAIIKTGFGDKITIKYSGIDSSKGIRIDVDYVNDEDTFNCWSTTTEITSDLIIAQLEKGISNAESVQDSTRVDALTFAKNDILANFSNDIKPIVEYYGISSPTTTTVDKNGATVNSSTKTNPDGSVVTKTQTVDPTTGIVTKSETVDKKVVLENKPAPADVTDPVAGDVPMPVGLNSANATETYKANNIPSNIDKIPVDKQDPNKGFKDPQNRYPLKPMANKPDTNPLAVGTNSPNIQANPKTSAGDKEHMSAGASPAARNASRKREVKTSGRNGASWSQPESPYAAEYPYNKVFAGESGHVLEIDDTPGAERLNLAHRSGTFTETGPDGTQVTRIVGDGYTIIDRDGYIMIDGIANVHVAGQCNVIVMSDTHLTMHGKVSVDVHNDMEVNIGGKLSLSVGGGIYAKNDGKLSLINSGNIDVDALGNMSTDVTGNHNLTSYGENKITSKGDIHLKTAGEMKVGSHGNFNVCSDAEAKITSTGAVNIKSAAEFNLESAAATNVKSGAAVNVEGAGNISLKAPLVASSPIDTPTLDVTTANITTANISTLNAGSTNLRATGTDTGTNGGSTHDLPISGPTSITASVTAPAAAAAAVDASCPSVATLSDTDTVEDSVSLSSAQPTQYVGGGSGGIGGNSGSGGASGREGENDGDGEDNDNPNVDDDCLISNRDSGDSSSEPTLEGEGGAGESGGVINAPAGRRGPICDTLSNGSKLPPIAKGSKLTSDIRLSENYRLLDFCATQTRPNQTVSAIVNRGTAFDKWDIVQNYRCIALTILEPLRAKYGPPIISSGFRAGEEGAHSYGAIDIHWKHKWGEGGTSKAKHLAVAEWIARTFPHDQILLEQNANKLSSFWIHIGWVFRDRNQRGKHGTGSQKGKICTMQRGYPNTFAPLK